MPNTRSAAKALRQNEKKRVVNLRTKRTIKIAIKDARNAIESGAEDATEKIKASEKILAKAAKSGFIKKNNAARRTSRLFQALKNSKEITTAKK